MSEANKESEARASLKSVIKRRYGVDIAGPAWEIMSPADAPPKGLRSADADDWQITLERASAIMSRKKYTMTLISLEEAEAARTVKLEASVDLLKAKASDAHFDVEARQRRNVAFYLAATAAAGVTAVLLTSRLVRRGQK